MTHFAKYTYKINEEISRWVFEVYLRTNPIARRNWKIAYANPSGGPWKRISVENLEGKLVELYRFGREELRPDLIVINDELRTILVIEAKDAYSKLFADSQIQKSLIMFKAINQSLSSLAVKEWELRKSYQILPGFLWPGLSASDDFDKLNERFRKEGGKSISAYLMGIIIENSGSGLVPKILLLGPDSKFIKALVSSFSG